MAARKLQQEVDKCFKKVAEGVEEFNAIYEKIEQSNNPTQKEKLEDNLKREIKKLQRLRDQIKTWAAGNEIKDKGPLMDNRKLIETQMERFKAVEKAMKTKAYSKEGLSAATKLDPKEQAKVTKGEFIGAQVDELEQQIETLEAESETIQATMKRGKMHGAKAERMAQIERTIERHKWHQGKLELLRRSLENGGVDVDQVAELEESIRYYVTDNMQSDFMEDDTIYDDLNLEENEDAFGMNLDNDKVSSQDNHSIQGDAEIETKAPAAASTTVTGKAARQAAAEASTSGRRPSAQLKSPLPALATLHTPLPTLSNGSVVSTMKPASIPTRPAGEGLKYASAAAAAAASDKLNLGIAPLPPPVGAVAPSQPPTTAAIPAVQATKIASAANSPKPTHAQMSDKSHSPAVSVATPASSSAAPAAAVPAKAETQSRRSKNAAAAAASATAPTATPTPAEAAETSNKATSKSNGVSNGKHAQASAPATATAPAPAAAEEQERRDEESIYHLPASLRDLVDSFEVTKSRPPVLNLATAVRDREAFLSRPIEANDAEPPRRYVPDMRYHSASNFPQEPLPLLDDPRLYNRIDPDTLFYVFYYKQGTYQQYLAAKALKDMSWRFHKQYQTWFQRHEEPKSITEEFEQGTYRFFDYESTWMNRRKADFKFVYKFLEDDV